MKKMLVIQITALLVISGALGGMLFFTDVYDEIHSRIVSVLCLSCIKLEPKTKLSFTFETANGASHSTFVLDNLTKGPVFLHYSEKACHGCDVMFPVVRDLFGVEFQKEDRFYKTVTFANSTVTHIYIYLDNTTKVKQESFDVYDKDHIGGLPMFSIVTLGYDRGVVRPYYTSLYGVLGLNTNEERTLLFTQLLQESIEMYQQNKEGYNPQ